MPIQFAERKKARSFGVNITPLIDLMFLLVIFILIAAQFEPDAGVSVDLPRGGTTGGSEATMWRLAVTAEGHLFFEREPVELQQLAARIETARANASANGKDPILSFYADRNAPFGAVAEALSAARRGGQQRIRFSMNPE